MAGEGRVTVSERKSIGSLGSLINASQCQPVECRARRAAAGTSVSEGEAAAPSDARERVLARRAQIVAWLRGAQRACCRPAADLNGRARRQGRLGATKAAATASSHGAAVKNLTRDPVPAARGSAITAQRRAERRGQPDPVPDAAARARQY
jgi:hypothetical protein